MYLLSAMPEVTSSYLIQPFLDPEVDSVIVQWSTGSVSFNSSKRTSSNESPVAWHPKKTVLMELLAP